MENPQISWPDVEVFQLDDPVDSYSFSDRLANENSWTIWFTQQAVLEYKRFMYLAAISTKMVSPSPIVDTVWHLHLIYSKSYQEFCSLLRKNIEHIPSAHNPAEEAGFKSAWMYTLQKYEETFGFPPGDFWMYKSFEDFFPKIETAIGNKFAPVKFWWVFPLSLVLSFLFEPVFYHIYGLTFLYLYIPIGAFLFYFYMKEERRVIQECEHKYQQVEFLKHLDPKEFICIRSHNVLHMVNFLVDHLISAEQLKLTSNNQIEVVSKELTDHKLLNVIINSLPKVGSTFYYPMVVRELMKSKTVLAFENVGMKINGMFENNNFLKAHLFKMRLALIIFLGIGLARLLVGIYYDKDIGFLLLTDTIFFVLVLIRFDVTVDYLKTTIDSFGFTNSVSNGNSWEWGYATGALVLYSGFYPLAQYAGRHNMGSSDSSSCGSSCGSTCGSSDGGGDGGDGGGGCGGCGGGGD